MTPRPYRCLSVVCPDPSRHVPVLDCFQEVCVATLQPALGDLP